jgi:hypothetical protein
MDGTSIEAEILRSRQRVIGIESTGDAEPSSSPEGR